MVKTEDAKKYQEQLAKPDLVFMTKENEAQLKEMAENGDLPEMPT